jgi:hypothetical protein
MDPFARFFAGSSPLLVTAQGDYRFPAMGPPGAVLLSGSFNPLHEGHWGLARVAGALSGRAVAFEISVVNVDKPDLSADQVSRRLRQFAQSADVWLTRAARFVDKATLFPGARFVVGADTAERLVAPRYYEGDTSRMLHALGRLREQGARFLVAGRSHARGRFMTLADLPVPAGFADLFEAIPESAFRSDLSSTALRAPGDSPLE